MSIYGIMFIGDSRQRHLFVELLEFLRGRDQMPIPDHPFDFVGFSGDYRKLNRRTLFRRSIFVPGLPGSPAVKKITAVYGSTWGEFQGQELRECWAGDDLANRSQYVDLRSEKAGPGLSKLDIALEKHGADVDVIVWTTGIHNARCSISDRLVQVMMEQEADSLRRWALEGLARGRNRYVMYRETVGYHPLHETACMSNTRLRSINVIGRRIVRKLDKKLKAALTERFPKSGLSAAAVYLGGMMSMSRSRPDRVFDKVLHYYPHPKYAYQWDAFPRLVNSEMLTLLLHSIRLLGHKA